MSSRSARSATEELEEEGLSVERGDGEGSEDTEEVETRLCERWWREGSGSCRFGVEGEDVRMMSAKSVNGLGKDGMLLAES